MRSVSLPQPSLVQITKTTQKSYASSTYTYTHIVIYYMNIRNWSTTTWSLLIDTLSLPLIQQTHSKSMASWFRKGNNKKIQSLSLSLSENSRVKGIFSQFSHQCTGRTPGIIGGCLADLDFRIRVIVKHIFTTRKKRERRKYWKRKTSSKMAPSFFHSHKEPKSLVRVCDDSQHRNLSSRVTKTKKGRKESQ